MSNPLRVYHGRLTPFRGSRVLYPQVQIGFDPILKKPIKAVYAYCTEREALVNEFLKICKGRLGATRADYWVDEDDKVHFVLKYQSPRKELSRKQLDRLVVHLYESALQTENCSGWVKRHQEGCYISTHPQPYLIRRVVKLTEFLQGGTIELNFPDVDPITRIIF